MSKCHQTDTDAREGQQRKVMVSPHEFSTLYSDTGPSHDIGEQFAFSSCRLTLMSRTLLG